MVVEVYLMHCLRKSTTEEEEEEEEEEVHLLFLITLLATKMKTPLPSFARVTTKTWVEVVMAWM